MIMPTSVNRPWTRSFQIRSVQKRSFQIRIIQKRPFQIRISRNRSFRKCSFQIRSGKIQPIILLFFSLNLRLAVFYDRRHDRPNVLTHFCVLFSRRWRVAGKSAEETHNLQVIVFGMLAGQTLKGIDTAKTDREHLTAQHFRTLLVAFVQQATLRCFRLALRRGGLAFGHNAAPDRKGQSNYRGNDQTKIADCRAAGFPVIQPSPAHNREHSRTYQHKHDPCHDPGGI